MPRGNEYDPDEVSNRQAGLTPQDIDNNKLLAVTAEQVEQLHIGLQDYVMELRTRRDEMLRVRKSLMERADLLEKGAEEINAFIASEWSANELESKKAQEADPKPLYTDR